MTDRTVFTFSAGPAMLPDIVLKELAQGILNYNGTGISVAELSHRGVDYKDEIFPSTRAAFNKLLNVPEDYETIFSAGGATFEFGNIIRNLMQGPDLAQYIDTGYWSKQAHGIAKKFKKDGLVQRIESINGLEEVNGLSNLRHIKPEEINENAAFVYICANETIGGVQYQKFPDTGNIPLVADMSSEMFTRVFDINNFGVVFACGQKNFGFAGFSVVIVRKDLIGKVLPGTIDVQDYKQLADKASAINTPPTVAIYTAGLIADYIQEGGGVEAMARQADYRSGLIYNVIDGSDGFYKSPVHSEVRSKLNIPFLLKDGSLEDAFKQEARKEGLLELEGHRSVGGLRASMYIGMPDIGAEKLAGLMQHFAQKHG